MGYRNGNYSAFYVSEPFDMNNLGVHQAHDFCFYSLLGAWKEADSSFPFNDSHHKTYSVRDGSDWEKTLKPRLHKRLSDSKNIILFLSSITEESRALKEELCYGIGDLGLPVIVVYPDFKEKSDLVDSSGNALASSVVKLWNKLPTFKKLRETVPTVHVPLKKELIASSLLDNRFSIHGNARPDTWFYTV